MFRRLDAARIVDTARRLQLRIGERFPGSGLSRVASDITAVAEEATALVDWLGRPHRAMQALAIGGTLLVVLSVAAALVQLRIDAGVRSWAEWVQTIEAFVNDLV
ncbi:MAG: hypothetical protein ABW321_08130, partial [Polyangiales bacterium]